MRLGALCEGRLGQATECACKGTYGNPAEEVSPRGSSGSCGNWVHAGVWDHKAKHGLGDVRRPWQLWILAVVSAHAALIFALQEQYGQQVWNGQVLRRTCGHVALLTGKIVFMQPWSPQCLFMLRGRGGKRHPPAPAFS